MKKKLTIGSADYDDFDGIYFSMNNLRLQNQDILNDLDLLIVDNNPGSAHGKETKHFARVSGIRYIEETNQISTGVRNKIFELSEANFALCMDCHVIFEPQTIKKLIAFYESNPNTNDLYHGPMLHDDLKSWTYYMRPEWWDHNFGAWGGHTKNVGVDEDPFEIPMHGLGMFTCRTGAWLGFNKHFVGFGGEEGYIHQKFKKAGHKVYNLPFLRWLHRFARPNGVKYPLTLQNKIRNYLITQAELGLPLQPIVDHFKTQNANYDASQDVEYVKSLNIPVFLPDNEVPTLKDIKI